MIAPLAAIAATLAPAAVGWAQPTPPADPVPVRSETHRLDPDQQRQLEHLLDDLADARLDLDRRRRAALILLERNWPAAITALKQMLVNAADPLTQRAIAQAVAAADLPDPQLIEPLYNLFNASDAALRLDAAAALGRFDDQPLTARLLAAVNDPDTPAPVRLGAIRALGEQRSQSVLDSLVKLVDADDASTRAAAFAALASMTGRDDIGPDAAAWKAHADRVRDLPPQRWLALLMRNLSARNAALAERVDNRTQRLTDAFARLYIAADETKRPEILLEMLGDQVVAIRRMSLDLIERRVLNAQTVDDNLRLSMRHHLTDPSPDVRAKVALLLRDLKDEQAQRQAVRLVLGETEPTVQAAYLSLMARVPTADAVEPAMLLLNHKSLRPAAASVLVAAAEAKLLAPAHTAQALDAARSALQANPKPDPAIVHLLGRVGEDRDLPALVKLLDHADGSVRLAAAEEFTRDRWPLDPLLDQLDDPTLRPVALGAAARRGDSAAILMVLLNAETTDADQRSAWQQAAESVASRLSAGDLATFDDALVAAPKPHPLHEQLLTAAAAPPITANGSTEPPAAAADAADQRRLEASFRLADLFRRTNQPAKARAALTRIAERTNLAAASRRRLALADIRLLLSQGLVDDAAKRTADALDADAAGPAPDAIAAVWLDEADAALAAERPAAAGRLAVAVDDLLASHLSPAARTRLTELVTRIKRATPTPTPPTPPGTTREPAPPALAPGAPGSPGSPTR